MFAMFARRKNLVASNKIDKWNQSGKTKDGFARQRHMLMCLYFVYTWTRLIEPIESVFKRRTSKALSNIYKC